MNIKKLVIYSLAISHLACVEVQDKDSQMPLKANLEGPSNKLIQAKLLESKETNIFAVQLTFNEGQFILRKLDENKEKIFETVVGSEYLDRDVKPAQVYFYQVGKIEDQIFKKVDELQVEIPFDIYVNGVFQITSSEQAKSFSRVRNLYFFKDSEIITNGFDVDINAKDIYSDNGQISTFHLGQTSAQSINGRNGGQIKIVSSRAQGSLTVNLRGENGANGAHCLDKPAAQKLPGCNGGNGTTGGDSGSAFVNMPDSILVNYTLTPGTMGIHGLGGRGSVFDECVYLPLQFKHICAHVEMANGIDGVDGGPGQRGKICFLRDGIEKCFN